MDATYSSEMNRGVWAEVSPDECYCRGTGWMGDDFDCWWKCPIHGRDLGVGTPPHPEAYNSDDNVSFDHVQHLLLCRRDAYRTLRAEAVATGPLGAIPARNVQYFDRMVAAEASSLAPKDMLAAAVIVTRRILQERAEESAQSEGYVCDLERRWADEAARERQERSRF